MRFVDVTVHTLSSPIDPPQVREFYGGRRRLHKRDFVLAAVETADGMVGYAPAAATSSAMREYFEGTSHDDLADLLETRVEDALAGLTVEGPSDLRDAVAGLDLPTKLASEALGVLDVAYHDLRGKELGAPVYELLAGDDVDPAPLELYASAGMYMEPEGYVEQAEALRERGYSAYKYRPGLGPEEDERTLRLLDEAVGDEMDLMVDAHTWWKLGERSYGFEGVVELLDAFDAHDPYWIEEPVEPADYDAYERLRERTALPLAGGESEESVAGLRRLAETGVDFLQGDVRHHAGFTGCWECVELCAGRADVEFVPHNFGTNLGLVANGHLVAASPEDVRLEQPIFGDGVEAMYPFPLADDVLETDLDIEDGHLTLPDGPGLGVEVDESVVEEYPYIEGAWTEFEYDDA
ncbi:mandelate racemase/muconate lactonizing enzyme family protein (plasmid) [Halarchaeum sp. CBA1220]|uniref:mandelate racemase/muconate lactonizing enzyme family protein n=1 Tax=Halarchaeum sp. CBA1220 TaxID=1853682 RepID=UPI000F3AA786|nr:mandelate racemase/muconate lactonizing enzyme family protein [Halarchaeum sp. CBA1220]QLC34741.1 mandelate racemase/muconate lactonizing enzyme family protein [Halarchaeum sp. CBA1220]